MTVMKIVKYFSHMCYYHTHYKIQIQNKATTSGIEQSNCDYEYLLGSL